MLAKPLQNQQGHPGPHPSTSRWRPPRRRPGRPARSLEPLHQPAYRTQRPGSKSALVASASLLAVGPARRTNAFFFFFFFFRQRTEGSALSLDEHEAPRMRSLIDATLTRCRRPCSSPRATLSDPSAWAREKKEKKQHFPEKFSSGNRAGIHKTEKLHGALILLCAGGLESAKSVL